MPKKEKGAPTVAVNMRLPKSLADEIAHLLADGATPYSDRTDLIKGAIRKEVDYLRKRKQGLILTSE